MAQKPTGTFPAWKEVRQLDHRLLFRVYVAASNLAGWCVLGTRSNEFSCDELLALVERVYRDGLGLEVQ